MKKIFFCIISLGLFLSLNVFAQTCQGLVACSVLYGQKTNTEVEFDKKLNVDTISLAIEEMTFSEGKAEEEFTSFLNQNLMVKNNYKPGKALISSLREGEYITAPIFKVTLGNIPPVFSKEGLVTLVYEHQKKMDDLSTWKTRRLMKKTTLLQLTGKNILSLSGTYENASSAMEELMLVDSKK